MATPKLICICQLASNGASQGPTTLTARATLTFEEIATIASKLTR